MDRTTRMVLSVGVVAVAVALLTGGDTVVQAQGAEQSAQQAS
jgi:hypothetical protein